MKLMHECFYGSKDYVLNVQDFECSESLWNDSVNFRINGNIPLHTTADGKLELGFACGCDKSHGGMYPQQAPPDNPNWDDYKEEEVDDCSAAHLVAWLDPGDSCENIDIIQLKEILEDEKASRILVCIIKDMFTRNFLKEKV
ncbi:MAG: hypothetical protein GF387_02445 [Candidatus Portnoybacteria bacterium]|nr:hypothetical protein [Candidatus Portnoybacteria bacterium]